MSADPSQPHTNIGEHPYVQGRVSLATFLWIEQEIASGNVTDRAALIGKLIEQSVTRYIREERRRKLAKLPPQKR